MSQPQPKAVTKSNNTISSKPFSKLIHPLVKKGVRCQGLFSLEAMETMQEIYDAFLTDNPNTADDRFLALLDFHNIFNNIYFHQIAENYRMMKEVPSIHRLHDVKVTHRSDADYAKLNKFFMEKYHFKSNELDYSLHSPHQRDQLTAWFKYERATFEKLIEVLMAHNYHAYLNVGCDLVNSYPLMKV